MTGAASPSASTYRMDITDRYIVPDHIAYAIRIVREGMADVLDWLGDTCDRNPRGGVRPETYVREHLPTVWANPRGVKRLEIDGCWPRAIVYDVPDRPWVEVDDPTGEGGVVSVQVAAWLPLGQRWTPMVEGRAGRARALSPAVSSSQDGAPW